MSFRTPWLPVPVALMLAASLLVEADEPATVLKDKHVLSTPQLAARIKASLVTIVTQDSGGNDISQGSGFFITPKLVATSLHVLKRASSGYIKSATAPETMKITAVFGVNLEHDVCVLYVSGAKGIGLPGSPELVKVGEDVVVGGNPEGLEASFSEGIISAIRQESGLIQMDAAISPGSSGGPVVNLFGEVIGVSVATLSGGQNLNFAVPIAFLGDIGPMRDLLLERVGRLAVSDLENEGFLGPIREYTESSANYSTDDGGGLGQTVIRAREAFNTNGRLAETNYFGRQGQMDRKTIWDYSRDGLVKRATTVDSAGRTHVFEFSPEDAIGIYAARIHLDGDEQTGLESGLNSTVSKYGSGGHLIEFSAPYKAFRSVTKYDEAGRAIEDLIYKHGNRFSVTMYTYTINSLGDWIRRQDVVCSATSPPSNCFRYAEQYRDITYYRTPR
jgi:Trypsin-like peptidase domain